MLDQKIVKHFTGFVVTRTSRKSLKEIPSFLHMSWNIYSGNIVTDDADNIEAGIESVKNILAKHYVHRNEAEW